jgi:uncharacterized RDD family membrane protein YckC
MANDPFATQSSSGAVSTDQSGYSPAGFWIRFVAALIDGVIVTILSYLAQLPLLFVSSSTQFGESVRLTAVVVNALIGIVGAVLYLRSYVSKGATPGKMIFGIKVLNAQTGMHMTFGRTLLREWVGKFLSILILGGGFLLAAFRSDKRALHDLVAGTIVVRKNK